MSSNQTLYEDEHIRFREIVSTFFAEHIAPRHTAWAEQGYADREAYVLAARAGIQGFNVPTELGGGGISDFRYNAIVAEEMGRTMLQGAAFSLHNDIVAPYLLRLANPEQKQRWLTGLADGSLLFAIAMSEPSAGSDLNGIRASARRDGNDWVLNGQKTFISNGLTADVVIVVARTDPSAGHKGISLLVVEEGMAGFSRGRKLNKMGVPAQDTAELFFDEVRVPASNLLGTEGRGFIHLMENLPSERLSIAIQAQANAEAIFGLALEHSKNRLIDGTALGTLQGNRFALAEMSTELDISRVYIDDCLRRELSSQLTAVDAAKAKWWVTELQKKVIDRCVQLLGSAGLDRSNPVAQAFLDVRIQTIYGGTTEIMKDIIGRDLGL